MFNEYVYGKGRLFVIAFAFQTVPLIFLTFLLIFEHILDCPKDISLRIYNERQFVTKVTNENSLKDSCIVNIALNKSFERVLSYWSGHCLILCEYKYRQIDVELNIFIRLK